MKEADPWTVMCSYNRINGDYASQNHPLLKEILKGEWGYRGAVISDWGANHTIVDSVQNGLDLEMPGPAKYYGALLVEAVQNWQIDVAAVNDATRRMLRMIVRSGRMDGAAGAGSVNTPAHQALARELAEEAITLLKNDANLLPLAPGQVHTIAVIGPNAAGRAYQRRWQLTGGTAHAQHAPGSVAGRSERERGTALRAGLRQPGRPAALAHGTAQHGQRTGPEGESISPDASLQGTPDVTRIDTLADYWWYGSGPAENIGIERFATRWTGSLTVPETGALHPQADQHRPAPASR